MKRTLIVRGASRLGGYFFGQAVSMVRVAFRRRRTLALKGAGQVDADGTPRARRWSKLSALINVPADTVWLQPVAPWADAEASLPACVDALLVDGTWVGCGTVSAGGNAVVVFPVEDRRTSTVAIVQAKKVSWTLELVWAANQLMTVDLRVARIPRRALA